MKLHLVKELFFHFGKLLQKNLKENEGFSLNGGGENSLFIRLNRGRIRQNTEVEENGIHVQYFLSQNGSDSGKTCSVSLSLPISSEIAENIAIETLNHLRKMSQGIPFDPFFIPPSGPKESDSHVDGRTPTLKEFLDVIEKSQSAKNLSGYLTAGPIWRAQMNSKDIKHWYSTESFFFDYTLVGEDDRLLKGNYAGTHWKHDELVEKLNLNAKTFSHLNKPKKKLDRGDYRAYLAPSAVEEFVSQFVSKLGEKKLQTGLSPFIKMRDGKKSLGHSFSLTENRSLGLCPRFGFDGEVMPEKLELISYGELKNTLISKNTEKEFGVLANGADPSESAQSFEVKTGLLKDEEILKSLDNGLFISNLHYLNWSDLIDGRITGMTRFACFWVENGEIVAPIENMRFDVNLFELLGTDLIDLTETAENFCNTQTYKGRGLGGCRVPGLLVEKMRFTL